MTDPAPTVSSKQAFEAQNALREALGLPPEEFPMPAFVAMLSDEIEQLRSAGKTDADISGLIGNAIGVTVPPEAIAEHYVAPEDRIHPD